jgi:hypothetical protein
MFTGAHVGRILGRRKRIQYLVGRYGIGEEIINLIYSCSLGSMKVCRIVL